MSHKLTATDLAALKSYAAEHGRNWKSALRADWAAARAIGDRGATLHCLRNRLGPAWLARFSLAALPDPAPDIKATLDAGGLIRIADAADRTIASARRGGADYVFEGITGRHAIAISAADAPRLAAHWNGFADACQAAHDANARRIEAEQRIAKKVVTDALAAGYLIDVDDGGDVVLRQSKDEAAIVAAMFSTDADVLTVRESDGRRVGSIYFLYGNGSEVLSDYTDKPAIAAVIAGAEAIAETLGA